ncbi:MAG: NAD-dependent epimerase/dehydratase family protein, partial [Planctomycetes bacterium]|nr:NAD-dependent epimerase/dehydratase family protein [Planctomycetota bacterium]
MNRDANVLVAGAHGMLGSAIVRKLTAGGYQRILAPPRREVDFTHAATVDRYMANARPGAVFVAAAKVGGILANSAYPADFLHHNLAIELNIIGAAHKHGVNKLLFLG